MTVLIMIMMMMMMMMMMIMMMMIKGVKQKVDEQVTEANMAEKINIPIRWTRARMAEFVK